MSVCDDICELIDDGVPLDDILVNDGDDTLGDDCAITQAALDELIREWESSGRDCSGVDLSSARAWLTRRGLDPDKPMSWAGEGG